MTYFAGRPLSGAQPPQGSMQRTASRINPTIPRDIRPDFGDFDLDGNIGTATEEEFQWDSPLDDDSARVTLDSDSNRQNQDNASNGVGAWIESSMPLPSVDISSSSYDGKAPPHDQSLSTPFTTFDVSFRNSGPVHIDLSRRHGQLSITFRTADVQMFQRLNESRESMCKAFECTFLSTISVQVDNT